MWSHKSGHGQEKIGMTPSPLCLARDGRPGWTDSGADQPRPKYILIGQMVKPSGRAEDTMTVVRLRWRLARHCADAVGHRVE